MIGQRGDSLPASTYSKITIDRVPGASVPSSEIPIKAMSNLVKFERELEGLMPQHVLIEVELPTDLDKFRLPKGVNHRLQELLDRQDRENGLTDAERQEAEGLVDLAELLSLLRLRSERMCT